MGCQESVSVPILVPSAGPPAPTESSSIKKLIEDVPEFDEALKKGMSEQDFSGVLGFLQNNTEIDGYSPFPKWAGRPTTISCLAIRLLNKLQHQNMCPISPSGLLEHLPLIIEGMSAQYSAIRHHLVYFMYKTTSKFSIEVRAELVARGLFTGIAHCFQRRPYPFQFCVAKLSCVLYQHDLRARRVFAELNGLNWLVSRVGSALVSGADIRRSIQFLTCFLRGEDGKPIEEFQETVAELLVHCRLSQPALRCLTKNDRLALTELKNLLITADQVEGDDIR